MNKSLLEERIRGRLSLVLEVKVYNDGGYTKVIVITDRTASDMVTIYCFVDDELVRVYGSVIVYDIPKVERAFKEAYNG